MNNLKLILLCTIVITFMIGQRSVNAASISCEDRFATIVNPIRGRDLWFDNSLKNLDDMYAPIKNHNLSATWLLQYDALVDQELIDHFERFDQNQEFGLFLEVSKKLANDARVIYPYDAPWFSPRAVFLSGYQQSDRRKLIDELYSIFYQKFQFYPKSVGAWWIDSYSLNYIKSKYGLGTTMIVADQKTTDHYGVWGQWWSVPYYPTKGNILTPANSSSNKQDVVIIQWAMRDPDLAYGDGPEFSNYSLQANDYTEQAKNTIYFQKLVNQYLDCQNKLGQVTVGLEVGQESIGNSLEFASQIEYLSKVSNLNIVTMNDFASRFKKVYPDFPVEVMISGDNSVWNLNVDFRENESLKDFVRYNHNLSFQDYFLADKTNFLDRRLDKQVEKNPQKLFLGLVLVIIGLGGLSYLKRNFKLWLWSMILAFVCYGLILRSSTQYGWIVFYSFQTEQLVLIQCLILIGSYFLVYLIERLKIFPVWVLVLTFGIDWLAEIIRYTFISRTHYLGISVDALRFVGISWAEGSKLAIVNLDLPAYQAAALLKVDFNKIWDNPWMTFIFYPALHLLVAFAIWSVYIKLNYKVRKILIALLMVVTMLHIVSILQSDPRAVL